MPIPADYVGGSDQRQIFTINGQPVDKEKEKEEETPKEKGNK